VVRMEGVLDDFFKIQSGIRQGCVVSPLLFSIIMDWILKRSMAKHAGIKWVDGKELSDLDFADDIVLLHDSWAGMQAMTSLLEDEAKKVGLMLNVAKTKIMTVGNWSASAKIKVGIEGLQDCEDFC